MLTPIMNELGASRVLYRGGLFLLAIFALGLILHELVDVLIQLFVASIIAAALTPICNALFTRIQQRRAKLQRAFVVVAVFITACALAVIFGFFVLRAIVREMNALVADLPHYADAFKTWLAAVVAAYPSIEDVDLETWVALNVQATLNGLSAGLGSTLTVLSFASSLLGGFLTVVLTVFMALYLTIDASRMRDYLVAFWPRDRQPQVCRMSNEMASRLGHWALGQALLCVIVGGGAWLGLQLLGVPHAGFLGLVWALAEFVPGIGPFLAAFPSILLGFSASPTTGVLAAAFSLVWSQVESNIITPKLMARAVELHPLVVLVSLIVGFELLAIPGGLLAIPAAATIAVVVDEIRQERLAS